jgi:RHS repeat-associated protein
MTEQNPIWGTGAYSYNYDTVRRLNQVTYPWEETISYNYDSVGNRLSETKGIYQYNYKYDAENRLTNMTLHITKPNIYPIHWWSWDNDNNGNQIAQTIINGTTGPLYSYDYENKLTLAEISPYSTEPTNVNYISLSNGDRIRRIADTGITNYIYDREDIVTILKAGAPAQSIVHGAGTDEPVAIKIGTDIYYYVQDGLGSIVALIKVSDGTIGAAYRYDAWGEIYDYAGPIATENPYLFTGREYDWETGVYHYRARSYDPHLGRFLQRDPSGMVDGTNMYAYCGNDPVNKKDPTGLDPLAHIWDLIYRNYESFNQHLPFFISLLNTYRMDRNGDATQIINYLAIISYTAGSDLYTVFSFMTYHPTLASYPGDIPEDWWAEMPGEAGTTPDVNEGLALITQALDMPTSSVHNEINPFGYFPGILYLESLYRRGTHKDITNR